VITAEIWPGGDEARRFPIGQITASNQSLLSPVSSYSVAISQEPYDAAGVRGLYQELEIPGHRRSQGVWALVLGILKETDL
jgi:hypothetical protein